MTESGVDYFVEKVEELIDEMNEHEEELYLVIELAHNLLDELRSISTQEDVETE